MSGSSDDASEISDSELEVHYEKTHLKLISIVIILLTSAIGFTFPVVLARFFEGQPSYSRALIKCFAAGVILSTSLVHILPDAFANCQLASLHPWSDFPFSGFVTLIGILLALLGDVAASSHTAVVANSKP